MTADAATEESYHRWLRYKQGFSPALVRMFLSEERIPMRGRTDWPILDPFSGAGTTVIECARQKVTAIGVDALRSMVFLTAARLRRVSAASEARRVVELGGGCDAIESARQPRGADACRRTSAYFGGQTELQSGAASP